MILILGNIVLFVIGIALLIIGYRYEMKHKDEYKYTSRHCRKTNAGLMFTLFNGFFTIIFVLTALVAHTAYGQDQKRIKLEEERAAIVQELSREEKDILLQGIKDAQGFNTELRSHQRRLDNPIYNWITSPVWDEFETIEY